ncbi:hypothetical protein [Methylocella silvestris]|uniref:Uncharacterized protein n=1 Tax=Methylocella silvestris TaxID=199596 RepID=A0A2J7TJT3_METSI|nr:hypothetical protein [Methylocella silvestris]PNG27030.1 hypothetical protein CR492_04820 [Methylocella silvestris]
MKSYETMYREALGHNGELLRQLAGANVRIRELEAAAGKRLNDYCRLEQFTLDLQASAAQLRKQLADPTTREAAE